MNDYITLDGKKYTTVHKQWAPFPERPVVLKKLLSGGRNVTFGPSVTNQLQGAILAAGADPETGFGTINDLRATYAKLTTLSFIDHYGAASTVVIGPKVNENSITPKWDAASNKFQVMVSLVIL